MMQTRGSSLKDPVATVVRSVPIGSRSERSRWPVVRSLGRRRFTKGDLAQGSFGYVWVDHPMSSSCLREVFDFDAKTDPEEERWTAQCSTR